MELDIRAKVRAHPGEHVIIKKMDQDNTQPKKRGRRPINILVSKDAECKRRHNRVSINIPTDHLANLVNGITFTLKENPGQKIFLKGKKADEHRRALEFNQLPQYCSASLLEVENLVLGGLNNLEYTGMELC